MTNTVTKEQLTELLNAGLCEVEFTKLNGEVRKMPCTLKESLIPVPVGEKKESADVMNVWSFDRNAWRSFRVANVISAKATS